ncbi:MAG: DegV family EDD domain-containing protein [Erysipelotrichales bacterium]|nr:DegV family EDD domain-containing protein [Erysipelotrichales bacterium]
MNPVKTAIMVDSGCDVPDQYIEQYDIRVVRLKIMYHDHVYNDGLDITADYVYDHFKEEIPKTSTPNVYEITELINQIKADGYEKILGISISSGLSGTYNAMATALAQAEDIESYMFDSKNISFGAGIWAVYAARRFEDGADLDTVSKELERKIYDSHLGYYMDTLDYLRAGGRITPSIALVGKILNLKPIISCDKDGIYYTVAKARGQQKALTKLVDLIAPPELAGKHYWIYAMHGRGQELLDKAKAMVRERIPDVEFMPEKQITPTMAIHTGPGLLGMGVLMLDDDTFPSKGIVEKSKEVLGQGMEIAKGVAGKVTGVIKQQAEKVDMEEVAEKAHEMTAKAKETAGKMSEAVKHQLDKVDVAEMTDKAKAMAGKVTEKAKETIEHFTKPSDKEE